jgi:hypothetical protein
MKSKLFLVFLMSILSVSLFAQMNISTNFRQDGIWDKEKEEWTIFSTNDEELTFFEFNKDYTMFKHTTASITSAYMIKSQKYDEENERYEFDVVSDVGNKYFMIFDIKGENVRFIYERDGELYLVQHSIKKVWFEEENE